MAEICDRQGCRDCHKKSMTILKPLTIFRSHLETYDYFEPKTCAESALCLARLRGENLRKISLGTKFGPFFC